MYPDGRRKNFYDGKGHMDVEIDTEKCRKFLEKTNFCHFNLMNWSRTLLSIAKELGHTISCDLQDIVAMDDDYRQDFIDYANVIFFSSVNYKDPTPLMKYFLKRHPNLLMIAGMGADGCAVGSKNGIWKYPAVEVIEDPVIDTNGAGDSLGVGFLSSYIIEGLEIDESVIRGQIAARHVCTRKASSSDLINREQMNKYFTQYNKNLT
jgi:sugar/nucleoside kinase (ribokinase family)